MTDKTPSAFSVAFAAELRRVMKKRGVDQVPVAQYLDRAQSFVSERTSGKRPTDTDIINAVAAIAGVSPRALVQEVMKGMEGGGTVIKFPEHPNPSDPAGTTDDLEEAADADTIENIEREQLEQEETP